MADAFTKQFVLNLPNPSLHNTLHVTARLPGWTASAHLEQSVRKLTEASFASDRLPSSSVDSLSSSSRSSETLMASVTTEMLRGGSVSFQPSGAYAQHTACCQTYCETACTPFHCKTARFVAQLRTPPTPVTPSALKDRTVHRPKSTRGITGVTVVGRLVPGDEHVNVFLQQKELN